MNTTPSPQPKTKKTTRQFRRSPALVPDVGAWTDRDEAILRTVAENRFVTTEQLHYLVPGSHQKLQRRLQQLYHNNYLDRPRQQLKLWGAGRKPFVYALGDRGAAHLKGTGSLIVGTAPRYWTKKNLEVGAPHIFHTLTITSFHVALARAAAENGLELTWRRESIDLRDYATVRTARGATVRLPINPDAYFALTWRVPGKKRTRHFFLEVDQGTMPNERETFTAGTSVLKKLVAYWQWGIKDKGHTKKLGIPGFVVLIATTSKARVKNLLATARRADPKQRGSDMFWLGTFEPHQDYRTILEPRWDSPTGTVHALTES